MTNQQRNVTFEEPEEQPLYGSARRRKQNEKPVPAWNKFRDPPRANVSGSMRETKLLDFSVKLMKILTIIFVFGVVLFTAVISKGTLLFMTSQIHKNTSRLYCNQKLDKNQQFLVTLPDVERATWAWFLIFSYLVSEIGTFIRSLRMCIFKSWVTEMIRDSNKNNKTNEKKMINKTKIILEFLSFLIPELCSTIGSAILVFVVLPEMDVIKGAMLTNAVCFVPAIVTFFSRKPNLSEICFDIFAIVAQASAFVLWPLIEQKPILYAIPIAVILISIGWWENFLSEFSPLPFIQKIAIERKNFKNKNYFYYLFISIFKGITFVGVVFVIYYLREDVHLLTNNFYNAFKDHEINVTGIEPIINSVTAFQDAIHINKFTTITTTSFTPIYVFLINVLATYMCYVFGKFACKVSISIFSYALPVTITVPVLLSALIGICGNYLKDECIYADIIPPYLFFTPPPLYDLKDFITHQHSYIWLVWLLSQTWVSLKIWSTFNKKLMRTEEIFMRPMYDAFFIDQSLALNRRWNEKQENMERIKKEGQQAVGDSAINNNNNNTYKPVTKIIACATMWHENKEEMMEFLKSIFRLDADHAAHRIVKNFFQYDLNSYYEYETHILFDDAFIRSYEKDPDPLLNEYVQALISIVDKAASQVHETTVVIKPPNIYPTPYGGRLVWTLPGRTKLVGHLKDKKKIRAKKRWSQVMYMYYLLGFLIMDNDEIPTEYKDIASENTYLLALDGDIDFQPEAVHLLMDFMKKKKHLGAACGRIHPMGTGAMVWYQVFEYAIGHWMQKATEHVIGCVLCSPGCFSLFRARALMDHSVMRKYTTRSTEAKHYVQYDQGEDRWLCTLLLQRGWSVEYSAASDAYTHCPEGFSEFYNQRRRWIPSTMANILDLLMDYKHTVEINDNISTIYIIYQTILLIGTILGPGTIFLMLVGAFVTVFGFDQYTSLYWNLAPILVFFIVCATCNSDVQLFFAAVISAIYGLVMMAVFIGVMLQIHEDGFLAPSSLFFFCVAAQMIIAAIVHPKEFWCLKYGVVYYVTVPSMYMLLIIYSVFNMNNVSWGTRDVTVVQKPKPTENKDDENKEKEQNKKTPKNKVLSFLGADENDNEGTIEFSLSKLFKCTFCTYRKIEEEDVQLKEIQKSLKELNRKLDELETKQQNIDKAPEKSKDNTPISSPLKAPNNNNNSKQNGVASMNKEDIITNSWFYDEQLMDGEVHYLDKRETIFWKELIKKYLTPYEDDKEKVAKDLKDLRDKMVFTFFMLNSLFVLVMFLLTLKKSLLHINWPVNPKVNFTYNKDENMFNINETYLELEPIGFVFLIFFALLLVAQFIGMLIHRFTTFSQIIANTNISFSFAKRTIDKFKKEEAEKKNALNVVKDLMKLKGINNKEEEEPNLPPAFRKSVSNIAQWKGITTDVIYDLEKAFYKRYNKISLDEDKAVDSNRRKSFTWAKNRLQALKYQKRLSQFQGGGFTNSAFIPENGDFDA